MVREYSLLLFQLILLWVINQIGYFIVELLHLPVPGNVLAMGILFLLLGTGIVPLAVIERASNLLIKHLAFFFIPIAVGLIQFQDLFVFYGLPLFIGLVASAMIGIYVTGFVSQQLAKKKEGNIYDYSSNHQ